MTTETTEKTISENDAPKRIGRFAVAAEGDLSRYLPIFAHVFPLRAGFDETSNAFEYVGLSELFDEVAEGEDYPAYVFHVELVEEAIIVKAKKVEDE